jgi:hypothetical protein
LAAADSVPAVIYSIPTNSPLHYVTYVRVYDSNAEYVYEGHTPGYYGTVVSPDGTVVYGTGYSYPSYIGDDYWYPPMYTYGYGSGLCWTPWYGWSFGFGFGWGFGALWYNPPFPYWGHNRFGHGSFGHRGYSNPGHFGRAYNSRTGQMISGRSGAVTNVFGAGRSPGFAAGRTHVYGSRSGHVYSYTPQGKTGAWSHLGRQSGAPPQGREASSFSRQAGARDLGEARYRSFRNNGGSSNISSPTNSHSSSSRSSGGRSFGGSGSGSRGGGSGFGGGGGMGGWGGKR